MSLVTFFFSQAWKPPTDVVVNNWDFDLEHKTVVSPQPWLSPALLTPHPLSVSLPGGAWVCRPRLRNCPLVQVLNAEPGGLCPGTVLVMNLLCDLAHAICPLCGPQFSHLSNGDNTVACTHYFKHIGICKTYGQSSFPHP